MKELVKLWAYLKGHSISIATFVTAIILFLQYMYDRVNRRNIKVMNLGRVSLTGIYKVVNQGTGDVALEKYGTVTFDNTRTQWFFPAGTKLKPDDARELNFCEEGGFRDGSFGLLLTEALKLESKHTYYVYVEDVVGNPYKFYPMGYVKSLAVRFWYLICNKKLDYK